MAVSSVVSFMQLNSKVKPNIIYHPPMLNAPKYIKSRRDFSPFVNAKSSITHEYSSDITTTPVFDESTISRRSGNYDEKAWDFELIQSLNSEYSGEVYSRRASELKMEVQNMMQMDLISRKPVVDQLELIDDMQKLAISYHFEDEIKKILATIYEKKYIHSFDFTGKDLYSTALEFRLLRQHGFSVSQEIFHSFKDENGNFSSRLKNDTKGLLALYEASYLSLEMARKFSTEHLKQNVINTGDEDEYLSWLVTNALKMSLHWRAHKPNARWFIEAYEKRQLDKNSIVLVEFAKLDYNILQSTYQKELQEVLRWWSETNIAKVMQFSRDRMVETYVWNAGIYYEPQQRLARIVGAKVFILITVLDDCYDLFGTLEELELFTTAFRRWDPEAINQLPKELQILFLTIDKLVDEAAYDVLLEQGILIFPYLRKAWLDICKAFLQETRWYIEGYYPKIEEYMENASMSVSVTAILAHAFFTLENEITKEKIEAVMKYDELILWEAYLFRLLNDLGTSSDEVTRGDAAKSIQVCMKEFGVSEMEARQRVKLMISEAWKNINLEKMKDSPFGDAFINGCLNLGRMVHYVYEHGDVLGIQGPEIKNRISKFVFEPIQ